MMAAAAMPKAIRSRFSARKDRDDAAASSARDGDCLPDRCLDASLIPSQLPAYVEIPVNAGLTFAHVITNAG